jgi:hypothetical protein
MHGSVLIDTNHGMQLSAMRFLVYCFYYSNSRSVSESILQDRRSMRVIVFLKEGLCVGGLSSAPTTKVSVIVCSGS